MGIDGEEALERIVNRSLANTGASTQPVFSGFPANFDCRKYIAVPQHDTVIATEKTLTNLDMFDTFEKLKEQGLYMPSIAEFMSHWNNVREASEGKRKLVYADGKTVDNIEAKGLWNYMSSTDRSLFNNDPCWIWLNAYFDKGNDGRMQMKTDLQVKVDKGKKYLDGKSALLETCSSANGGFVRLNFNRQGLPVVDDKRKNVVYEQGENLYFWKPVEGRVAGFYADSGWAGLDCNGGPSSRNSSLGVFACAEGTAPKKSGGSK